MAWGALIWSAALLYFQVHLQSDSVYLEELSRNLFSEGGDWWWWRFPPAPAYVPDMVLYFIGYGLLPDVTSRIFFVSFVQVVLLGLAVMFFVYQLQARFRPAYQAAAVGVVTLVTLVSVHSDLWLYFYSTNNHFGAYLFPLIGLGAIFAMLRRFRIVWVLLLFVASVFGAISTSLFTLSFAFPAGIVLALLIVVTRVVRLSTNRARWTMAAALGSLIAGVLAASVLLELITPYGSNTSDRLGISEGVVIRGLLMLVLVLKYLLGGGGPVVLALTGLLAAATLYVGYRVGRRVIHRPVASPVEIAVPISVPRYALASSQASMALVVCISALSFVISLSVSTLLGGLFDEHGYRYVILSFMLTALVAVMLLVKPGRRSELIVAGVAAVLLVLAIVSTPVKLANPRSDAVATPVAECLQDLRNEGVVLTAGIGDYWLSRGVSMQLEDSPPMLIVWGNLEPNHWMNSMEPVVNPEKYGYHYDFALVHPGTAGEPMYANADEFSRNLPAPTAVHECSTGIEVWTWADGALDETLRVHFDQWIIDRHIVRGR